MTTLRKSDIPTGHQVYIETGVGYGSSLKAALEHDFERLIGIEVNGAIAQDAAETFKDEERVSIGSGSSVDHLPHLLDPQKRTVFFLDSHYEPGVEASYSPREGQCPLLAELGIILAAPWVEKPVILIDDYAIFMSNEWWYRYAHATHDRSQWPTIQQIFDAFDGLSYKWNLTAATNGILYCW